MRQGEPILNDTFLRLSSKCPVSKYRKEDPRQIPTDRRFQVPHTYWLSLKADASLIYSLKASVLILPAKGYRSYKSLRPGRGVYRDRSAGHSERSGGTASPQNLSNSPPTFSYFALHAISMCGFFLTYTIFTVSYALFARRLTEHMTDIRLWGTGNIIPIVPKDISQ